QQKIEVVYFFSQEFEHMRIDRIRLPFGYDIAETVVDLNFIDFFQSRLLIRDGNQHRTVKVQVRLIELLQDLQACLEGSRNGILSAGHVDADVFLEIPSAQEVSKGGGAVKRFSGKRNHGSSQVGATHGVGECGAQHEFHQVLIPGWNPVLKGFLQRGVGNPFEEFVCPCHFRPFAEFFLPEFNEAFESKNGAVRNFFKLSIISHKSLQERLCFRNEKTASRVLSWRRKRNTFSACGPKNLKLPTVSRPTVSNGCSDH